MGRMYVFFDEATVTAANDLIEFNPGADKPVVIHSITITQTTEEGEEQAEMLPVVLYRITGSFVSGSGGSSLTPFQLDGGDAVGSGTPEGGNSTVATGTLVTVHGEAFNVQAGWYYRPTPEERPVFTNGKPMVLRIPVAPTDSITFYTTVIYEEIG